ncbi:ATP-binding cassette domain-containing protein [Aldersonia sp. NBC_00410]|uniref:ABC transporter ATP-binding protein n=1 Tax=Aldersonia sp. NBC_00410 TaxID=2975954 RepID=UPI00224FA26C|nr:ATP-binding cassette domain-containing protein [Aldersonia sp. NBC_00410]MCX5043709.1 ATP-binding cassette domain-containing protein [Aldersonia sp. NBC_00410]
MSSPFARPGGIDLRVVDLTKEFGRIRAVDDLSFSVPAGAVTAFLGPNGAGKTTTLRMMLGLVRPTAGVALFGGSPYAALPEPARTVGAVLDTVGLHPGRTALGHLEVFGAAVGVARGQSARMLAMVGLERSARMKVRTFSLGMRQRLALATALLGEPRVLVLDEPANGLDPEGTAWLREFLRSFASRGGTVLTSSHILREVEHSADNLVVVNRGALVYEGSLESLRRHNQGRVLVASASPARLATALAANGYIDAQVQPDGRLAVAGCTEAEVGAVANAAGVEIFGMVAEQVDLEQIFLAMTATPPPGGGLR